MTDPRALDPKGLIREAYAITGLGASEARSIFLDWALGQPAGHDPRAAVQALLEVFASAHPADHPMTEVLRAALSAAPAPRRRGGRAGRMGG